MMQRLLAYDPYWGDLNNVRLCIENVAVLAHLLDRRLIISPKHRKHDEPEHFPNGDYRPLDPRHFLDFSRIRTMQAEAVRMDDAETYHVPHFDPDTAVIALADGPDLPAFAGGRAIIRLPAESQAAQIISLPRLLTPFYAQIYAPPVIRRHMTAYVRDRVRHYAYAPELAARIADGLHDRYFSVVVRRNEFITPAAYPQADICIEQIEAVIAERAPPGSLLVVATDEINRNFFRHLARRYRCVFARDLVTAVCPPGLTRWQISCVEQNLCALGESYVGTRLSTFSAYVNRIRGYIGAADTSIRFTDLSHRRIRDDEGNPAFSWQPSRQCGEPLWAREFQEGWC